MDTNAQAAPTLISARRRKPSPQNAPLSGPLHGLDAARKQVELITGSADTECGFRTIKPESASTGPSQSIEVWGTIDALYPQLQERCQAGCNVYIVPQAVTRPSPGQYARSSGITEVRCLYADYDGTPYATEHHVEPTFRLDHAAEKRHWDVWAVTGVKPAEQKEWLRRIAQNYGSDEKVSTVMITRLAGFDRWKDGKNCGPYTLTVLSGQRSDAWEHDGGLPALPPRQKHTGNLDAPEVIAEWRLRGLLAFVEPAERPIWLNTIFAMREATVLDAAYGTLDEIDVEQIADEWASGELHAKHTGPKLKSVAVGGYKSQEDTAKLFYGPRKVFGPDERRAGLASLVHYAEKHAKAQGLEMPPELRQRGAEELFKPVGPAAAQSNNDAPASTPSRFSELVKHFEGVLSARGGRELRGKRFGDIEADECEVKWVIHNWLQQGGVISQYGESGVFKTYVALNMLGCVTTGTPWAKREGFPGYRVGEAREAVIFAGEGSAGVGRRIKAMIAGNGFDRALVKQNLIIVPVPYSLNRAEGLAGMAEEIEVLGARPALIVVDTLNLALDGNEDSSEEIKKAISGGRALADMFDAVLLVIDHAGHGDKTRQRGSSAKKANQDGAILCERTGDTVKLTQKKNRDADMDKFAAAFKAQSIEVGADRHTGEPIKELWFEAVDPTGADAIRDALKNQDASPWLAFDAAAREYLDGYSGLDIKATDLAQMIVREKMPDLAASEPAKFEQQCKLYRKHLVRPGVLAGYVANQTRGREASTFCNPAQNGRRANPAKRACRRRPDLATAAPAGHA